MSSENRLLKLENLVNQIGAQLSSVAARLAALEQAVNQLGTNLSGGGSGGTGDTSPAVTSTSITAKSGTTPGTGSVTMQAMVGGVLVAGATQTIYSNFAVVVPTATNCEVGEDSQGNWWLLSAQC